MYLDTDIVLALIKKEDWLKKYISIKQLENPKTSALTVIEARIVLLREHSRDDALGVLKKVKNLGIKIISVDDNIIKRSQELIEKYSNLNMFDSVHAACAIHHNEELVSTDSIFSKIGEVTNIDPREII
jgi:predicted nucleic acid-binding protein